MNFLKKYKKTNATILLVIILAIGIIIFNNSGDLEFETEAIERGIIRQIVSETGVVKASEDITLSFARSGRLAEIYFTKGDFVKKGQTIAILDTSALKAQLAQAEAALERVKIEKTIERAEISLLSTKQDLVNTLLDIYTTADDAIRNKADQAFVDGDTDFPEIVYAGNSYSDRQKINRARSDLNWTLKRWEESLVGLNINSDFEPYIQKANENLLILRNYLAELSILVNKFQPIEGSLTEAQVDAYQAAVFSARSSINTEISSLNTTVELYDSEKTAFEKTAEVDNELVTLQNIKIKELQSQIDVIYSQINDAIIVAPISGTVTATFYSKGESVSATSPVVSVISNSNFEITVYIPEDDIANVDVGDRAEIEFDAYDKLVFGAEVVFVSNSAEIIEGIPAFEVSLQFDVVNEKIKSGLSADIDIVAEQKENVVIVSTRAIIDEPTGQFIRVIDPKDKNSYTKTAITLGLKGEGGIIEVLDGVKVGDQVITFIKSNVLDELKQK